MPDLWTEAIEEARASASVDQFELVTFELLHPAFVDENNDPDSIRGVLDQQDWDLELEAAAPLNGGQTVTFKAMGFRIIRPAQEEAGLGQVRLSFDHVSREVQPWLDEAVSVRADGELIIRTWLATRNMGTGAYTATGGPAEILKGLTVRDVVMRGNSIELTAHFKDVTNIGFPRRKFGLDDWPGLHS